MQINQATVEEALSFYEANRIFSNELVLRVHQRTQEHTRALFLPSEEIEHVPQLAIQVVVSPCLQDPEHDTHLCLNPLTWETAVLPTFIRVGPAALSEQVRQYRFVQKYSKFFYWVERQAISGLGAANAERLFKENYLDQIDWRLFFKNASELEGGVLQCAWGQCKLVRANSHARFSRQFESRRLYSRWDTVRALNNLANEPVR